MAQQFPQRNDSSQMKMLLQPDDHADLQQEECKPVCEGECDAKENTHEASACPVKSLCVGDEKGSERKSDEQMGKEREEEEAANSCCSLDDLKRLPKCHRGLDQLSFSKTHTVLIDVDIFNIDGSVTAQEGRDMWHNNFVKMPCSPASVMTAKTGLLKLQNSGVKRWGVICKELERLAKKKEVTVDNVMGAIMEYNPKYKGQWSFDALSTFVKIIPEVENYYPALFTKIAALALKLHRCLKKAIPLLQKGHTASITLSQVQIACLLANAFYCTFPHRNTSHPNAEYHNYPTINFHSLFGNWSGRKKEKLRAILHYFKTVTDDNFKGGLVTFERHCLKDADIPKWRSCKEVMSDLHVTSDGHIETEGQGMLQVDFACNLIGGGVLSSGLVQEEILFLMNPELIVSRLFTERLGDDECLIIKGSQQFSHYSGYKDSFEWAGPHDDSLTHGKRDEWSRLHRHILAIDAVHYKPRSEQYNMIKVTRELNKAYCGFKAYEKSEPDIATGKWGCGAFNGDPELKAVIQLMAAAVAKRGMAFFALRDNTLKKSLQHIYHLLTTQEVTVGRLYGYLEDYCAEQQRAHGSHLSLFHFLFEKLSMERLVSML